MKAVKIKLYQNMVNYRTEMSYGYVQTYPLPTPSMVKGMAHALLGLETFNNLRISIQGDYSSVVTNMQRVYKFDRARASRPRNPYDIIVGTARLTAMHGVIFVDQIVHMNLILHICFDDEELNEKLLEQIYRNTVVLGRNEDIARVDFETSRMVELTIKDEDYMLMNNIFIDQETAQDAFLSGTAFRLPFYYSPVTSNADKRIFKFVDAMYVAKNSEVSEIDYLVDEDNDIVNFLSVNIND